MNEAEQWQGLTARVQQQCRELDRHITRCLELGRAGSFDFPRLEHPEVQS